jgi:hypothetical protein
MDPEICLRSNSVITSSPEEHEGENISQTHHLDIITTLYDVAHCHSPASRRGDACRLFKLESYSRAIHPAAIRASRQIHTECLQLGEPEAALYFHEPSHHGLRYLPCSRACILGHL